MRPLLEILKVVDRPLVFFDIETTGLADPVIPIEFAVIAFGLNFEADVSGDYAVACEMLSEPELPMGEPSDLASGLFFAASSRLNPGKSISPGATAVHGITDEMVGDAPRFDDPAIVEIFRGLEELNAIFVGHNIRSFDIPKAIACGWLTREPTIIDTLTMARAIAATKEAPDVSLETCRVPAVDLGLEVFRSNLGALHVALCDRHFDGAHGALADVVANARVFSRMLELWCGPLREIAALDRGEEYRARASKWTVRELLAYCNRLPPGEVGFDGWLKEYKTSAGNSVFEVQKGKNRGRFVHELGADDLKWIASLPDLDDRTRDVLASEKAIGMASREMAGRRR